ncbi:MAG: PAS domain S-box protein [Desulfotignum sp.]|nr:PAS domain S-box protein [Desulfotignum sp.]MCF8090100.1 PAS domain S-box protein [Desulfotignum sp.]
MSKKTYEKLEKRIYELEKLDSERNQCLEAMRTEQTFLSAVLDNVKEAIIICDNNGTLVRFNEAARQLHGIQEQAILPDQWADYYSLYQLDGQTPLPTDEIPLYRALMGEKIEDAEIVVAPKHAVSHVMVCNGQALLDSKGKQIGAVVAMHDITGRKRAEERNAQLLARIRTTLEATADGILVVDQYGKQLFFSKRFAKMWGIPGELLETKEDEQVLAFVLDQLTDPDGFLARVNHLYAHPEAKSFDTIEFKDGRIFERYSRPHKLNDKIIGRVWSFRDVTEQKLALSQLQQSERKYKELVENLNDVIFLVDKKGLINYVSDPIEKVLGYKPNDLTGQRFSGLIHPDDLERITQKFADILQGKLAASEYRFLSKNNEYRWVRTSSRPHFKDGQLVGVQGVLADVTDRKRAEEQLGEQSKTLRDILEKAADGICVCHNIPEEPYVRFTHWNPRMAEITGYSMEEINGAGWYQSMYPDPEVQQKAIERMNRMRHGDNIKAEEWIITCKNSEKKTLSMSTSVIKKEDGSIHVLAIIQDITERKQTEIELTTAKTQWEETFDAISDWVSIIDKHHTIIRSNSASNSIVDLSPEEVVGKHCYQIVHGTDCPISDCPAKRAFKSKQRESMELKLEDGRWIRVLVDPIGSNPDGPERFVHVVRDITDAKKQEQNLISARKSRAFSLLAGGIAHDYNNLLSIIMGNISLLQYDLTESVHQEILEDIENACEQSKSLTHQFHTLSEGWCMEKIPL